MKEFVANEITFEGSQIDNNSPEFMAKAQEYNVDSAPTFIIFDDDGKEVFRGSEAQEVKDFFKK